ncbi:unnamed protein product [Ilex paraguariensis]|uniref:Cation/H+ exchanger transmembrane domain-containing protein n=1 Tax=Ilex paraguariensis TaxID=185542 RepID=A0ABC8T5E0_9AQUA
MGVDLRSVVPKMNLSSASDYTSIVAITLFVALLCACIVIGHLLEENRWMNESITALAIGLSTGVVILLTSGGTSSHLLLFSEDLFFIYLLPPIIFNAGFQVKKKQFFRNFMTITLFGAVGTLISFVIISLGHPERADKSPTNNDRLTREERAAAVIVRGRSSSDRERKEQQ